jgi:hypothetical protein
MLPSIYMLANIRKHATKQLKTRYQAFEKHATKQVSSTARQSTATEAKTASAHTAHTLRICGA